VGRYVALLCLDFYRASSLKEWSVGRYVALLCLKKEDFIGGVMVSMLASSVVDHELEHLACQSKTIHWHLLLSIQH
jgi:hypothetical protein